MNALRWLILAALLSAFLYFDYSWVAGQAAYPLAPLAVLIVGWLAFMLACHDFQHGIEEQL